MLPIITYDFTDITRGVQGVRKQRKHMRENVPSHQMRSPDFHINVSFLRQFSRSSRTCQVGQFTISEKFAFSLD